MGRLHSHPFPVVRTGQVATPAGRLPAPSASAAQSSLCPLHHALWGNPGL